jgi:hypothetical protein
LAPLALVLAAAAAQEVEDKNKEDEEESEEGGTKYFSGEAAVAAIQKGAELVDIEQAYKEGNTAPF